MHRRCVSALLCLGIILTACGDSDSDDAATPAASSSAPATTAPNTSTSEAAPATAAAETVAVDSTAADTNAPAPDSSIAPDPIDTNAPTQTIESADPAENQEAEPIPEAPGAAEPTPRQDRALVRAGLLRKSDVPADYTSTPDADEEDDFADASCGADGYDDAARRSGNSPSFAKNFDAFVATKVVVYPDADAAEDGLGTLNSRKVMRCTLRQSQRESDADANALFHYVGGAVRPAPAIDDVDADQLGKWRLAIVAKGMDGTKFPVNVDLYLARVDRTLIMFSAASFDGEVDHAVASRALQRVVQRVRAQG